jgi:hypothetical protein
MPTSLYKKADYSVERLIDEIDTGEIGLPDIQRPFVWTAAKVRDLLDSMYRGFPVGYLLFWANAGVGGVRYIGDSGKQSPPRLLIVDGQQRLTSLYAVLRGVPIINEDYEQVRIRIAFRPRDGHFAVADAAVEADPEFISNVSRLWVPGARRAVQRTFFERVSAARDLSDEERDRLEDALEELYGIKDYPFTAMELSAQATEEQVAEVFVRINSQGATLNQDDFILTLMSVFWEDGRRQLEAFSRDSRRPTVGQASAFNHFIQPDPGQLLRVSVAFGFKRGALRHVYSLLRGRDLQTGQYSSERRDEQFETLREAQQDVLDLTNWHEFLKVLIRGGFRSGQMITSTNAVLYSYAFFLIGRRDYGVDSYRLRQIIARWFFAAALTGRYTSSPESRVEQDLRRLPDPQRGADAFVATLDAMIEQVLTPDFWRITLPSSLATSSPRSPELFAYYAALILLDARVLFSHLRISELFDPSVHGRRSAIERHHLFPRAYLARIGVVSLRDYNQIANFALVEWPDNNAISDRAPADYFPSFFGRLDGKGQEDARFLHALPPGWEQMEYSDFLEARRRLIADVVRQGYLRLRGEEEPAEPDISALIAEGEGQSLEFKSTARVNLHTGERDPKMEWVIVKTIAGFANASGGTLLIGVDDSGAALGLADDLKVMGRKQDVDGYELWLRDLLVQALGQVPAASIAVSFPELAGVQICRIDVPSAGQPVFANQPKVPKTDDFYLRLGNSTRQLTGRELLDHLREESLPERRRS